MYLLSDLPQLIYQKGSIEIEYLPSYCTLTLSWTGPITQEDYQTALLELLKFVLLYEIRNLLIDARDSDTMERGDKEWLHCFFSQQLSQTKIRKIARIGCGYLMREAIVSKTIMQLFEKYNLPFTFRYVNDVNSALEWFTEA